MPFWDLTQGIVCNVVITIATQSLALRRDAAGNLPGNIGIPFYSHPLQSKFNPIILIHSSCLSPIPLHLSTTTKQKQCYHHHFIFARLYSACAE